MKKALQLHKPANRSRILWKYLDLHRFIYLLTEKKFFFSRLDKLDDPFEGIAPKLLKLQFENPRQTSRRIKMQNTWDEKRCKLSQKLQFVNGWFAGERESMAMWNLHSNADAVALKADFADLASGLKPAFEDFVRNSNLDLYMIGKSVRYLKLNPFDEKITAKHPDFSALKKDKSFEYEKEYRFLVAMPKPIRKTWLAIPVDLEKLRLKVISHPNIEDWKFKNLQNIVELCGSNIQLEKSPVLIKEHS